jgi:uncharacterized protein YndB with AHSA1/START domain
MTEENADSVQLYMIFIKATPERVWDAITKPEDTSKYFHGSHVEAELKKGGKFWYHSPDKTKLWGDGEVLELDPPKRLVTTWHALWDEATAKEKPSRVIWEIEAQDDGVCKVTITHDWLEGAPITAKHVGGAGWNGVISGMKTLIETGSPMRNPPKK